MLEREQRYEQAHENRLDSRRCHRGIGMVGSATYLVTRGCPSHLLETLAGLTLTSVLFGIPAIAIGWVAQAIIVMLGQVRKH